MIRQHFKGDFDCKRFPKGDNKESFSQLRVLKLPIEGLEKEETPDEKVEIEDKKGDSMTKKYQVYVYHYLRTIKCTLQHVYH